MKLVKLFIELIEINSLLLLTNEKFGLNVKPPRENELLLFKKTCINDLLSSTTKYS